jgi:cytochrome c
MRKRTLFLLIIAAGIAGCAGSGWVMIRCGFSARDNPSALETYIGKTARRFSIPASERNATNPFAPTAEVLGEARAHFADHCAICHGNDGSGKTHFNSKDSTVSNVLPSSRGSNL